MQGVNGYPFRTDGSYINDVIGTHPLKLQLASQNPRYISSSNKITSNKKQVFSLLKEIQEQKSQPAIDFTMDNTGFNIHFSIWTEDSRHINSLNKITFYKQKHTYNFEQRITFLVSVSQNMSDREKSIKSTKA